MKKLTSEEAVEKFTAVHGGFYDYSEVVYTKMSEKVKVICPKHGPFYPVASNHAAGKGCKQCSKLNNPAYANKPITKVISDFMEVHGSKYTYIGVLDYVNSHTPIRMLCNLTGQDFYQTPSNHLSGKGCSCCSGSGFDTTRPAILYYLSIDNGKAYKIGITNRTVQERYSSSELSRIKVLSITHYEVGLNALDEETSIKNKFKTDKYKREPLLLSGNTELFSTDILNKEGNQW